MSVYGNSYLTTIAWKAKSPTQAARWAEFLGCSKEQVKAVRKAAKIKRDRGTDGFLTEFSPFEELAIPIFEYKQMTIGLKVSVLDKERPLNSEEFNQVASVIEHELAKLGVEAEITKVESHPFIKSTL